FLDLSYNQIKEIKGIKNLKNLKFLDLRNNKIVKISQLEKLKVLQYLYLGFNQISDNKNLEKFRNIKVLDIKNLEEKFIPCSLLDFYPYKIIYSDTLNNKFEKIRDVKFIPHNFTSKSVIKDLSVADDFIKFFTNSSWMFLLKNNEYETFKLSKNGYIEWLQRSRK
ncbi:MAG: leucine-rich repeat domain-containing protein, partial [Candidatus Odinarchaeota archaeon]